jgi:hypothetical protein
VRCVLGCCEVVVVMMVVVVAVLVLVVVVLLERRMLPLSLWMLMHITSTKNKNPCLSSVPRPVALSSGIVASCFCASMSLHVRVHACARMSTFATQVTLHIYPSIQIMRLPGWGGPKGY